jgi:hypothetical protein
VAANYDSAINIERTKTDLIRAVTNPTYLFIPSQILGLKADE